MKHTHWIAATTAAVLIAGGTALGVALPAAADDAPVAAQTEGGTSSPDSTQPTDPSTDSPSSAPETTSTTPPSPDTASPDTGSVSSQDTSDSSPSTSSAPASSPAADHVDSASDPAQQVGKGHDPVVICHKPGDPAQQTLTVDDNALKGHLKHGDTLGECAPLPVPVEGWWIMPNGGTAEHVTWPQTATPAGVVPCGTTAQVDTYPSQAALDKLAADGVLTQGEDYGIAISWRFVYGGECPVEPGPANPAATITTDCGVASVLLTNDGENILTGSFVVYVDGEFFGAYAVAAGDHQTVAIPAFAEDSGDHVVTVRTGPAFGDEQLATATVTSDCEPAVVVPPTDTPTPPVTPPAAPPAPQQFLAAPAADTAPVVDQLAQTGSNTDEVPLWLGGAVLLLALGLGAVSANGALRRRRAFRQVMTRLSSIK